MHPKQIMYMGLLLASGTMISLTFGGAWLGTSELALQDSFTVFKQATILGVWNVTVPNVDFFLVGAKSLIQMDFAFFSGVLIMVQWVLYLVLGLGVLWGIYIVVINVIQSLWRGVRG